MKVFAALVLLDLCVSFASAAQLSTGSVATGTTKPYIAASSNLERSEDTTSYLFNEVVPVAAGTAKPYIAASSNAERSEDTTSYSFNEVVPVAAGTAKPYIGASSKAERSEDTTSYLFNEVVPVAAGTAKPYIAASSNTEGSEDTTSYLFNEVVPIAAGTAKPYIAASSNTERSEDTTSYLSNDVVPVAAGTVEPYIAASSNTERSEDTTSYLFNEVVPVAAETAKPYIAVSSNAERSEDTTSYLSNEVVPVAAGTVELYIAASSNAERSEDTTSYLSNEVVPVAGAPGSDSTVKTEKSATVDPAVTVTLCVMAGSLKVRGWDKPEIRARSTDDVELDFRRIDKVRDSSKPASRIDVMVVSTVLKHKLKGDCQALADVEMDVPVGATVQVQTRDGDINITGVAAAYAGSQNGDIVITKATKLVEAGSVGGSIILKDSSGRVNLSSAGGGVDVANLRASSPDDVLEVGTVSGDIQIERVSVSKVVAKTVNGTVMMTGPLTRGGSYNFTTMGGDMVVAMPRDASFLLNAKVSKKEDVVSEFALKYLGETPPPPTPKPQPTPQPAPGGKPKQPGAKGAGPAGPKGSGPIVSPMPVVKPSVVPYVLYRVNAIYGSGDATISVASFGGTLTLKKL